MKTEEILDKVRERCAKNRQRWSLQHDIECHPDGDLARLALAKLENNPQRDPFGYPASKWTSWIKQPYIITLIEVVALLVQEAERFTERL